jgi:transketolase N-terminal domain/subunit
MSLHFELRSVYIYINLLQVYRPFQIICIQTKMSSTDTVTTLERLANLLRIHSIESTQASNSGHPTSCSSMAEITSVLFFNVMHYDPKDPRNPASDRFVLSKVNQKRFCYNKNV